MTRQYVKRNYKRRVVRLLRTISPLTTHQLLSAMNAHDDTPIKRNTLHTVMRNLKEEDIVQPVPAPDCRRRPGRGSHPTQAWVLTP